MNRFKIVFITLASLMLASCSNFSGWFPVHNSSQNQSQGQDASSEDLDANRIRSILVLPPVNQTNNKKAYNIVLSQVTEPLAEKGYYVLPVAVTTEMLRQNGVLDAAVAQKIPVARLREIFGADAALYLTITEFGKVYNGPEAGNIITINALLADMKTGASIWQGRATANSNNGVPSSDAGLFGGIFSSKPEQQIKPATTAEKLVAQALDVLFSEETNFTNGPYLNNK